jgi:hypothetical protein
MDLSRIISISCVFLLSICLILCISVTLFLRSTVKESTAACMEVQALLERTNEGTVAIQGSTEAPSDESAQDTTVDNSIPTDVLYHEFCMRESGGRISIYTSDGYLVKTLDRSVATLPYADQVALREGINLSSWREVLALIQDFEA